MRKHATLMPFTFWIPIRCRAVTASIIAHIKVIPMQKGMVWLLILWIMMPRLQAQEIPLRHFTTRDGLPSNNCYRLIDDEDGRIWVSTDKGIVRYNGYEFEKHFRKAQF